MVCAGVAEALSVMIEGESLLNDGVAILLFEIFHEILIQKEADESAGQKALHIFGMFMQIAIGGPAFGWIMGKLAVSCLSLVFNDAVVEVTISKNILLEQELRNFCIYKWGYIKCDTLEFTKASELLFHIQFISLLYYVIFNEYFFPFLALCAAYLTYYVGEDFLGSE